MTLFFDIKVTPNSGRQKFVLDKSGQLKCFLKSVPEKGKANCELVKMIAKKVSISKKLITIVNGATSRKKRIKIDADLRYDQFLDKIGIERQLSI